MAKKILKLTKYLLITLIWLGLWQFSAMQVGEELLFPTPLSVALRIGELLCGAALYKTVALSLLRILLGMLIGTLLGAIGGLITALSPVARDFFAPPLAVIKATPVASFIILLVLWVSRDTTPLIIAAMMVTPVVWANVESGILHTDTALLEMAKAYKMPRAQKLKHIYVPSVSPYFFSALRSSLGMAWKAGIAAEVLLQPLISIGKMIFEAKHTLETVDLFAWTVIVVLLSVLIEKVMVTLFRAVLKKHAVAEMGGEKNA